MGQMLRLINLMKFTAESHKTYVHYTHIYNGSMKYFTLYKLYVHSPSIFYIIYKVDSK